MVVDEADSSLPLDLPVHAVLHESVLCVFMRRRTTRHGAGNQWEAGSAWNTSRGAQRGCARVRWLPHL